MCRSFIEDYGELYSKQESSLTVVITEELVCLLDSSDCHVFFLKVDVIFTIEDILDDIRFRDEIALVFHELDHFLIFEVGFEMRDNGGISECFACTAITIFASLFAVWIMHLHFMWTNITDT